MKTIFILLLLLGFLSCGKNPSSPSRNRSLQTVTDPGYFYLMNDYRIKLGLLPLTYSSVIEEEAKTHSEWMASGKGPFGHEGWEERCKRLRTHYRSLRCGEIVAMGQKTPERVLEAWLGSPPHRASIEFAEWTHTGVGVARNTDGKLFWTQIFLKL